MQLGGVDIDQLRRSAVLAGEPVVGEMQIDARRLDRAVPGLSLHRLQRHARLAQPGQTGVAQLMAGAALQPGPSAGAGDDLIQSLDRERSAASWPFQHDEDPVGVDPGRSFLAQIVAEHGEEGVGDRHQPLMAALAVSDEHRSISYPDIAQPQPEHFATAQPAEQHRQHHRPIPRRAQRPEQGVDLARRQDPRQRLGHPHQRHRPSPAARSTGLQASRHRVRHHRRVAASDQIGVEARHRRQSTSDRASRQSRLMISHPDHRPIAALLGEELEHIRRPSPSPGPVDHGEEHLQVERHRPHRVRPTPPSDELEIAVNERITQCVTRLTRRRHGPDQTRERVHPGTLTARPPPAADAPRSPVY